jgi:hypothetical protein
MAAVDFYMRTIDPSTGHPLLGRKAIFNCVGIEHARDVAHLLCESIPTSAVGGRIPCATIHGNMYRKDIRRILAAHKAGEIVCLTQAKMMGEGHDDPDIKLVINLKPSLSMVEVPQRGGRAMRFSSDNSDIPALIVDFIDESTLNRKLPLLFSEITGSPAYGKWLSTRIKRRKYQDVFSDDMTAEKKKGSHSCYFRIPGLEVVWSPEHVTEILKKRHYDRTASIQEEIYPAKDSDWLSAEEIASHYNVPVPVVVTKMKYCRIDHANPGVRIDQQKKIEWRMERRSLKQIHVECLHASQITEFGKIYKLDTPYKTDDWLAYSEVAERLMRDGLRKVDGTAISSIVARLKKTQGMMDCRHDPKTMKQWRVGKKRHKRKIVICLHVNDFDSFCSEYHLDVLEHSMDFLYPDEIATRIGQKIYTTRSGIEKYLKACLDQNNMMGKHLSEAVEYRYVSGRPLPCLRRNAFPAFVAFQKAEAERHNAERQAHALKYREERRRGRIRSR